MKKMFLIPLLTPIFLSGCHYETTVDTRILDLAQAGQSATEIKLSDFAESISYIPLETRDSVILSGKIRTAIGTDHILVYDRQAGHAPVLFDRTGHYIARIGQIGHGPGEWLRSNFLYMNHISFDESRETVSFETSDKRYLYSYTGNFLSEIPITVTFSDSSETFARGRTEARPVRTACVGDNIAALVAPPAPENMQIDETSVSELYKKHRIYVSRDRGKTFDDLGECCDMTIILNSFSIYTVPWNVFEDHIAIFDYGKGTYERFYYTGEKATPYIFKSKEKFGIVNSKSQIKGIYETPEFLFIEQGILFYVYDKAKNELLRVESGENNRSFNNDLDNIAFSIAGLTPDGMLYGLINASEFREQAQKSTDAKLRTIASEIKEDDNQVVALIKPKRR